jgi:enoyl-CoA hydratase/carnithine racemase
MLDYRSEGATAWVLLNRPDKKNALERAVWGELRELLAQAEMDDAVRAVVIHGAGDCFSVGGDIVEFGEIGGAGDRRAYMVDAMAAYRAVEELSKPVIAAVHGYALGGGCELTIVCDIVIADETARFGTPEAKVGLVPGPGVARGLAQINLHWMKLMVLGAQTLTAEEARLAGLVNRVVPAGGHVEAAAELAEQIGALAPLALAAGKHLLNGIAPEGYAHAIDAVSMLQGTDDFQEGIRAFRERRPPRFSGR